MTDAAALCQTLLHLKNGHILLQKAPIGGAGVLVE